MLATLALFLALGGVGYAAIELCRGQVKARHIASGAVRSSELRDNYDCGS